MSPYFNNFYKFRRTLRCLRTLTTFTMYLSPIAHPLRIARRTFPLPRQRRRSIRSRRSSRWNPRKSRCTGKTSQSRGLWVIVQLSSHQIGFSVFIFLPSSHLPVQESDKMSEKAILIIWVILARICDVTCLSPCRPNHLMTRAVYHVCLHDTSPYLSRPELWRRRSPQLRGQRQILWGEPSSLEKT